MPVKLKRELRRSEGFKGLMRPLSSTRPTTPLSLKEPMREFLPEGPEVELETTPSKDVPAWSAVQAPTKP